MFLEGYGNYSVSSDMVGAMVLVVGLQLGLPVALGVGRGSCCRACSWTVNIHRSEFEKG